MMKKLLLATALMLAPFSVYAGSVKTDMLDPLVKINGTCSAIGINIPEGRRLLTAYHCVTTEKEGTFKKLILNEKNEPVQEITNYYEVVRVDQEKDLALLKARDEKLDFKTAEVATEIVAQEGDQVWTVGYPLGFERVITEGLLNVPLIDTFNGVQKKLRLRASPNLDGGNSGGALFQKHDNDYELIGVTSMMFNSNRHMGIYIPLKDIREFLRLDIHKSTSTQIDQR